MPNSFRLEMIRALVLSVLPQILCGGNFIMFSYIIHKYKYIRNRPLEGIP